MLIHADHKDEDLLQEIIVEGCEKAFETLFKRHHGFLYHYAFRVFRDDTLADEVVHNTFIKIWNSRENLCGVNCFKSYLFSVNRRLVIDELRSISRDRQLAEGFASRIVNSHNSVEEDVIYNDLEEIANKAIEELPPKRKEIFKLSRHGGYSHKEIANKLNISENTVKVSVSKSLKQIRHYLSLNAELSCLVIFGFALL